MTTDVKFTEKELMLLLNQRSPAAFTYLYDRYAPVIYGLVLKEVKNGQLASEILKTTFINIFKECKNLDCVKHSLFTWLLSLTRQTASSDFKIDIDVKSVLFKPQPDRENHLHKDSNYRDMHHPVSSLAGWRTTIG